MHAPVPKQFVQQCLAALYLVFLFSACQRMVNYPDAQSPVYISHQERSSKATKTMELVSFNIEHSNNIQMAIQELKADPNFADPEIMTLQEMDLKGVQQIAEAFRLNYLYYPCVVQEKEFGNAILSKFKISDQKKNILPAIQKNNRLRNAPSAVLDCNGQDLLVYAIHNSTITMPFKKRRDQIDAIISSLPKHQIPIIIAGDFNTLGKRYKRYVYEAFEAAGFINATEKVEYSSKYAWNLIKIKNDHIFVRGLNPINSKMLDKSKSSDHKPIYLEFDFERNTDK